MELNKIPHKPICFLLLLIVVGSIGWYQWQRTYSLENVLRHAYLIEISEPGSETPVKSISLSEAILAEISPGKAAYYNADTHQLTECTSSIFSQLKQCNDIHHIPRGRKFDYVVKVYTITGKRTVVHYNYIASTGELGRNNEWCAVPNNVRIWIKGLAVPKHDLIQTTNYRRFSVIKKLN